MYTGLCPPAAFSEAGWARIPSNLEIFFFAVSLETPPVPRFKVEQRAIIIIITIIYDTRALATRQNRPAATAAMDETPRLTKPSDRAFKNNRHDNRVKIVRDK